MSNKSKKPKDHGLFDGDDRVNRTEPLRTKDGTGRRIRLQFDIDYKGHPGKKMDPDSNTLPDMNITVAQLFQLHTRGGSDKRAVAKQPLYLYQEVPVMNDLADAALYRKKLQHQLKEVEAFEKAQKAEQERLEKDEKSRTEKEKSEKDKNDVSGVSEKEKGASEKGEKPSSDT